MSDVVTGCYQPAGPLIPMSPGWDVQKIDQPAVQQLSLASPGSVMQAVTSQTTITSASITGASHPYNIKSCEEYTQVPAVSRITVESVQAKPQKMVSPGSVEVGIGTHSSDRKSSRSRLFHSSIRPSEKSRNSAANVPIGAAHLVVADQERELDLSQKGNPYGITGSGATVVMRHESIVKPAIGVVHEVSHSTVASCSSGMSQIGHLERFVHGLMTSGNGLPATQGPQIMSHASNNSQTVCSPHDSGASSPKLKPEHVEDSAEERQSVSPKKAKYSVENEECSSEVQESFQDEPQPSCSAMEDPKAAVNNLPSGDDASAGASVKQDCELNEDTNCAVSLPDVFTLSQSCEDQQIQHTVFEEVSRPTDVAETVDSCELVTDDPSSSTAYSSAKNHLPSPLEETPNIEQVGNPKIKDTSSSNPKKATAAGTAETKSRMSPVRSKSATELNKKRTPVSMSVPEKKSEKVGTALSEKSGRRSADEGSVRSMSARRKRDTGGWEWYGDPERKPVYFKVIWLC